VNRIRDLIPYDLIVDVLEWEKNGFAFGYWFGMGQNTRRLNTYLFGTRKEFVGLSMGNPDVKVEYHVCFLDHGDVTRKSRLTEDVRRVFEIISECYVIYLMNGEAFSNLPGVHTKVWKWQQLERKSFGGRLQGARYRTSVTAIQNDTARAKELEIKMCQLQNRSVRTRVKYTVNRYRYGTSRWTLGAISSHMFPNIRGGIA
jgi:hypothetical protein